MAAVAPAPTLRALVLEEWPGLDPAALDAALDAAQGGSDALVALLAEHSGHTRALARRKLAELEQLVAEPAAPGAPLGDLRRRAEGALSQLEERARKLRAQVEQDVVPQAEAKFKEAEDHIKQNLLVSLLVAMGFGLLVGLILGGSLGRGR